MSILFKCGRSTAVAIRLGKAKRVRARRGSGALDPHAPRRYAKADLNNTNNRPQAFSACSWL
jgi:hypothetical protein